MLRWRLLMSAVLIPGFVAVFVADHRSGSLGLILLGVAALLAARAGWELGDLLAKGGWNVAPAWFATSCPLAIVAFWLPRLFALPSVFAPLARTPGALVLLCAGSGLLGQVVLLAVLFLRRCLSFRAPAGHLQGLSGEAFGLLYVATGIGLTAQLRWLPNAELGYLALGSVIVAVKCGDIFAYTFGRLFGRRKMAPHLSPGKTWAGFAGALLGGGTGTALWFPAMAPLFGRPIALRSLPELFGYGIVLALVGVLGDLSESLIKREVNQKDASALLPGFGGLLDLLDSVLYSGPLVLLWWLCRPPVPGG